MGARRAQTSLEAYNAMREDLAAVAATVEAVAGGDLSVDVHAKSDVDTLGNSLVVSDVLHRARPAAIRYFLGAPHYRSDLDWSEEGLADADTALMPRRRAVTPLD